MSMRYPGGLIATSPVNARYPSGVWTQAQAAPYQAQNVWTRDQFWPYTTLLLQGDGAVNGAQNNTFLDSSSNNFTITRNGNTTQGSFTPYEQDGYWSNFFGSNYLQTPSNSAFDFGTGSFTVEAFVFPTSFSSVQTIVGTRTGDTASTIRWVLYVQATNGQLECDVWDTGNNRIAYFAHQNSLQSNAWNHVALVRNGTEFRLYVNGVQSTSSATSSAAVANSNLSPTIGQSTGGSFGGSNAPLSGYLSSLRIVKGTAVYTSAFTPSTAPLTAITNTSLLTCQSNRFKDNSTNNFTITVNGSPSVQSFQPFPGATTWSGSVLGGSGYFDGSGDTLSIPSSTPNQFGSGDFTIECWYYCTGSISTSGQHLFFRRTTVAAIGLIFLVDSSKLTLLAGDSNTSAWEVNISGATTLVAGTWYHFAATRSGSTWRIFVNGVQDGTATASFTIAEETANITVGSSITGYLSGWSVLKGTAQYTSNFTVPTAPPTVVASTAVLMNFTNAGIFDSAMMNDLETVGNAQVSTSVVKYGTGSMAFDGNGDYLLPPSSPNLAFGTGGCTIEFWYYANSSQGTRTILVGNNLGFTTNAWNIQINNTSPSITNKLQLWAYNLNSSAVAIQGNTTLVANNWYHVALVRNGSTFTFYLNGVSEGTTTSSASLDGGGSKTISIARDGTDYFNGYIDDLRITKAARYIGNFTPPVARMPQQ